MFFLQTSFLLAAIFLQILTRCAKRANTNSGIEIYDDFVKSRRVDIDEKTNVSTAKRELYPNNSKMANFSAFSIDFINKIYLKYARNINFAV